MRKTTTFFTITLLIVMLSSCGTLFTGTRQKITVSSSQPGSEVYVNNAYIGKTPSKFSVNKKLKDEVITVKKEGYVSQDIKPQKGFNGVAILNLLNPIAWGIDLLTGGVNRIAPKEYNVKLEPEK